MYIKKSYTSKAQASIIYYFVRNRKFGDFQKQSNILKTLYVNSIISF